MSRKQWIYLLNVLPRKLVTSLSINDATSALSNRVQSKLSGRHGKSGCPTNVSMIFDIIVMHVLSFGSPFEMFSLFALGNGVVS